MDFKKTLLRTTVTGMLDGKASVSLIDFHPRYTERGKTPEHHVANCARISFGEMGIRTNSKDDKLISYLAKHNHSSPFEMCNLTFKLVVPRAIAVHILRHRMGRFNEVSQRYCKVDSDMYSPLKSNVGIRLQNTRNKQCSFKYDVDECMYEKDRYDKLIRKIKDMEELSRTVHEKYVELLDLGMARESARFYLPQGTYTTLVMNIDLNNFSKFLALRTSEDAQIETRAIAGAMLELAKPLFPITMDRL